MTTTDGNQAVDQQKSGASAGWHGVGASIVGTSHVTADIVCQDAHFWRVQTGDVLVAAVADGAGSALLAEVGAEIAAKSAVEAFCAKGKTSGDEKGIRASLSDALKEAQKAVRNEASARQVDVQQLSTTLILVVATSEMVAAAQIGDGIAVVRDQEGNTVGVTSPESGEHVNETTFLTSGRNLKHAQLAVWRGAPTHVAIMSDGLQRLALRMPSGVPHAPFFAPLFNFVSNIPEATLAKQQLEQFMSSPRITDNTTDDLTLVLFGLTP
jgi:hypothetical protein